MTLLLRLDGCIEADLLARALLLLQGRHPRLRACFVKGEEGTAYFRITQTVPPIPFEIKDYDADESPWREEAHRLMQSGFPAAGPLAAVAVLRNRSRRQCDLLLTAHHAIVDGVSAITLADDLLTEYARAEAEPEASPRDPLPIVTAPGARSGGWMNQIRLVRRLIRVQQEERRTHPTPLPQASEAASQCQWAHWVFSREETLALIRQCRREQTSIGAALIAAVICGLMDCLSPAEGAFKCTFPFDVRPALKGSAGTVTTHDVGCFASLMNECYQVRPDPSIWDVARRAHQNHTTFIQQGGPAFNYNLAAAIAFLMKAAAAHRLVTRPPSGSDGASGRSTLLATYYGILHMHHSYGSLRPAACTLTLNNAVVGPQLILEALVMGQQLNIGLTADNLEPVFWEQLQNAVRRRLVTAVHTGATATSAPAAGEVLTIQSRTSG